MNKDYEELANKMHEEIKNGNIDEALNELETWKADLIERSEANLNEAEARWFEKIAEAKKEVEEEMKEKIKNYEKELGMKYGFNKMWAVIGLGTTALAMSLVAYAIAATEK